MKNLFKENCVFAIILFFIFPNFLQAQTRLATSPLMIKSQEYNGVSSNPLTHEDSRASFAYSTTDSSVSYTSPSDYKLGDETSKQTQMQLGYDGITSFGHFSGGYYSSKKDSDLSIKGYSSCGGQNPVYDYSGTEKNSYISGAVSGKINNKIEIVGSLRMVNNQYDLNLTSTAPTGCVWSSNGESTVSYSGSASSAYNQISIAGKSPISNDLNVGFVLIPEASNKTSLSGDFSSVPYRNGNGMTVGAAIGKEGDGAAYEGGIAIEQENKDAGRGANRVVFVLYESLFSEGAFLAGYKSSEVEKVTDGSTNIARPFSSTTIDLEAQVDIGDKMFASFDISTVTGTYGDYGDSTADAVKEDTLKVTTIGIAINALF